jgi:hypothetical protein
MSGVEQAAHKECAQIMAGVLGRVRDMTNLPRIGLKLESGSPTMHTVSIEHDWQNAAGEVWGIRTDITVITSTVQRKWKEGEEK